MLPLDPVMRRLQQGLLGHKTLSAVLILFKIEVLGNAYHVFHLVLGICNFSSRTSQLFIREVTHKIGHSVDKTDKVMEFN